MLEFHTKVISSLADLFFYQDPSNLFAQSIFGQIFAMADWITIVPNSLRFANEFIGYGNKRQHWMAV